jgi:DNA-binding GntR family transcriptional regulator
MVRKIVINKNIRGEAYELIRNHISTNAISPGGKINENELARLLGVSKTPVREALSRLAHDGIVEIIPNRGAFKTKLSRNDIDEVMTIREVLEGLAIRVAAKNITSKMFEKLRNILAEFDEEHVAENFLKYQDAHNAFYALIYHASKSPRLVRFLQSISDLSYIIAIQYFRTPERVSHSVKENNRMLDALEKGDVDLAESIRKQLVCSAKDTLMSDMS